MILFHVLDPQEIQPKFREPVLLVDMENNSQASKCRRNTRATNTAARSTRTSKRSSTKARGAGLDYFLMNTGRPLDEGLREYLAIRQGRM